MVPAVAGPRMRIPMNAICISALAETSPCAGTVVRIVTCCAGPKNADTQLSAASTKYTCQTEVDGISSTARPARIRSLATSVGLSGQRSTNTPAIGPTNTMGSMYAICTPVIWLGVPCMANDTTTMTANSARKSPNRLITCAYHTRRITSMRRTSLNDRGAVGAAGAAAVAVAVTVDMGSGDYTLALASAASNSS